MGYSCNFKAFYRPTWSFKNHTERDEAIRGDLIEVFKIMNGLVEMKPEDFLISHNTGTRGHSFKLFKKQTEGGLNLSLRKYFFS